MDQRETPTTDAPAMTRLPPPPPPPGPPHPAADSRRAADRYYVPVEAGQLTLGWRIATAIVWGLVFVCFIAVWKTSRELGLSTWWLGPVGDPAGWWVSMLPFLAPVAMIMLAVNNAKWIPWFGLGASAACAVVAALDIDNVPRLAIVEFAIAGSGALTAIAGLSGRYAAGRTAVPSRGANGSAPVTGAQGSSG